MRNYLLLAILISVLLIVMKWNLVDTKTHRWILSDRKNRAGFGLLSLAIFLFFALLIWD